MSGVTAKNAVGFKWVLSNVRGKVMKNKRKFGWTSYLDTVGVRGSIPREPTILKQLLRKFSHLEPPYRSIRLHKTPCHSIQFHTLPQKCGGFVVGFSGAANAAF